MAPSSRIILLSSLSCLPSFLSFLLFFPWLLSLLASTLNTSLCPSILSQPLLDVLHATPWQLCNCGRVWLKVWVTSWSDEKGQQHLQSTVRYTFGGMWATLLYGNSVWCVNMWRSSEIFWQKIFVMASLIITFYISLSSFHFSSLLPPHPPFLSLSPLFPSGWWV